jgi:hypothetical protein
VPRSRKSLQREHELRPTSRTLELPIELETGGMRVAQAA